MFVQSLSYCAFEPRLVTDFVIVGSMKWSRVAKRGMCVTKGFAYVLFSSATALLLWRNIAAGGVQSAVSGGREEKVKPSESAVVAVTVPRPIVFSRIKFSSCHCA